LDLEPDHSHDGYTLSEEEVVENLLLGGSPQEENCKIEMSEVESAITKEGLMEHTYHAETCYQIDNDTQKKYDLTPKDCTFIRENFKAYDKNHDGTIERSELCDALGNLGPDALTEECLETIFSKIDTNCDRKIEYLEFVEMYGLAKEKGLKKT
jgi:hypothetical protein